MDFSKLRKKESNYPIYTVGPVDKLDFKREDAFSVSAFFTKELKQVLSEQIAKRQVALIVTRPPPYIPQFVQRESSGVEPICLPTYIRSVKTYRK